MERIQGGYSWEGALSSYRGCFPSLINQTFGFVVMFYGYFQYIYDTSLTLSLAEFLPAKILEYSQKDLATCRGLQRPMAWSWLMVMQLAAGRKVV